MIGCWDNEFIIDFVIHTKMDLLTLWNICNRGGKEKMPRRKRLKHDDEEESSPSKRVKLATTPRRSTRNPLPESKSTSKKTTKAPSKRGTSTKAAHLDIIEISSDSSSLSDPPSILSSPTPPKSTPITNGIKAKRASIARGKKVSMQEHEDALNR